MITNTKHPQGHGLKCSGKLLAKILAMEKLGLVIFIRLQRYEKGLEYADSHFRYTTAVVTIDEKLKLTCFAGKVDWSDKSEKLRP